MEKSQYMGVTKQEGNPAAKWGPRQTDGMTTAFAPFRKISQKKT